MRHKSSIRQLLLPFWGLCVAACSAHAATFYVSTSGSDSNPGTLTQPWKTIQKAADSVAAGDVVIIGAGDYDETITTRTHGTMEKPIVFQSAGQGWPVVRRWKINASDTVVKGLKVQGPVPYGYAGVSFGPEAHRSVVRDSWIGNLTNKNLGIRIDKNGTNYLDAAQRCIISNNFLQGPVKDFIHLNGGYAIVTKNTLDGNQDCADAFRPFGRGHVISDNVITNMNDGIYNKGDHLDILQVFGNNGDPSYEIVFERNFCANNAAQICQLTRDPAMNPQWREVRDWHIRNNVFVNFSYAANVVIPNTRWHNNLFLRCTTNTAHVLNFGNNGASGNSGDGAEVVNNIFAECGKSPGVTSYGWYGTNASNGGSYTKFIADFNFVAGPNGAAKSRSLFMELNGINGGSPQWVNPTANDFSIRPDSPLRGAGSRLDDFVDDIGRRLRSRNGAWDIGPYMFVDSGANGVFAPLNLRVATTP